MIHLFFLQSINALTRNVSENKLKKAELAEAHKEWRPSIIMYSSGMEKKVLPCFCGCMEGGKEERLVFGGFSIIGRSASSSSVIFVKDEEGCSQRIGYSMQGESESESESESKTKGKTESFQGFRQLQDLHLKSEE